VLADSVHSGHFTWPARRVDLQRSALEIFPGGHPFDGSTGYTDTFRTRYGPVFAQLRGLPAAAVNGGWQLLLLREGTRNTGGTLPCWEVVVRTK
jgi:hypothetical protein